MLQVALMVSIVGRHSGQVNVFERPKAKPRTPASSAARLTESSRGELARLARILHPSRCSAVIRGVDDTLQPLIARGVERDNSLAESSRTLSAPIYNSDGMPFALLDLTSVGVEHSSLTDALLRAIADSSAQAITERWFRIVHLRHWILAAQPANDPGRYSLLAVDRDRQLVGADHTFREILARKGLDLNRHPPLSALFHAMPSVFGRGRHCERSVRLLGADDAEPWFGLITPPDLSDTRLTYGSRVLMHSRPRVDTVVSLSETWTDATESRGLSPGICQRIDEFIEARLETRINITQLASSFGISASHFFKRFRKSFGMTPHAYIMRRRLSLAQDLLAKTDIAMVEIAMRAGFADQSHFSRNFHRFTGLPPREFRLQHS
jgi:AraC-like DNA-binding protein